MQGSPGCALRKIEGSQVLGPFKGQGARPAHDFYEKKKLRLSVCPGATVWHQGLPGTARAQPWYVNILIENTMY